MQPRVLHVLERVATPIPGNRDRIEAVLQLGGTEARDPCACYMLDLAAFLPCHCFERMTVTAAGARFDLDESDRVALPGDDIDFLAIDAIAALEHVPAVRA